MSITFLVGSYFGSKIAISLDQKMLKRVFGVLMFVTAFKMFFDSYK
ncbi:MAG: hypothetical protein C4K58_08070 [Flavobacteriaceae bacterium]|nr:MAG: hypothetical protein C4K58_08070 [Flavobacteriaceae bacterium]